MLTSQMRCLSSHTWSTLRSGEANDNLKDSFLKWSQHCILLYLHACMRAVDINYWSWIAVFCKYALFCWLHCLAHTSIGNVLKQTQIVSRRQHKIPLDEQKNSVFGCFSLLLRQNLCTRHSNYLKCTSREKKHCGLKEQSLIYSNLQVYKSLQVHFCLWRIQCSGIPQLLVACSQHRVVWSVHRNGPVAQPTIRGEGTPTNKWQTCLQTATMR